MWKKGVDNERKAIDFQIIVENVAEDDAEDDNPNVEELEKRSKDFNKILEVSSEERDRIQVIDRATAAIAVARSIPVESKLSVWRFEVSSDERQIGALLGMEI
ncbi:Protein RNA-directed DNA methylation like [Quillaja saponaria]|uniref:Protein RNA-directed DNA methylation like n=1 Tax=Quillaja saponaria TaxID=32244 RepID=A0AAD7QFL5_QUISA|nr:Protein RNA-directed DNA methylation like [Quillaja saponaria]